MIAIGFRLVCYFLEGSLIKINQYMSSYFSTISRFRTYYNWITSHWKHKPIHLYKTYIIRRYSRYMATTTTEEEKSSATSLVHHGGTINQDLIVIPPDFDMNKETSL